MAIALLQRVPGSHAQMDWDGVALTVREMVRGDGEAHDFSVDSEDVPGHVVVIPHRGKGGCVGGGDGSELWTATGEWGGDRDYSQIVDHPPLVPPTLIIDHKESGY